jgi:hypothetical protein
MEGSFLQFVTMCLFTGFILAVCVWQLISTSMAKKRRIQRERARHAEGIDGAGI